MIKKCVICGKEFSSPPSTKKVTCSLACRSERARRANTAKGREWSQKAKRKLAKQGQTENLKLGTPAAQKSPIAGPFETNRQALDWVLEAPDGTIYRCRNLNLWLRENADILPGTVEQARAGIMQMKRSKLGKTKRAVNQWKGWVLISWSEPKDRNK